MRKFIKRIKVYRLLNRWLMRSVMLLIVALTSPFTLPSSWGIASMWAKLFRQSVVLYCPIYPVVTYKAPSSQTKKIVIDVLLKYPRKISKSSMFSLKRSIDCCHFLCSFVSSTSTVYRFLEIWFLCFNFYSGGKKILL